MHSSCSPSYDLMCRCFLCVVYNRFPSGLSGLIWSDSELVWELSLAALHSLNYVKRLDLEGTQVEDEALCPLLRFQQLNELSLKGTRLTDLSLYQLSSLPNLINLSIGDTVLTNGGLNSFKPPATLKLLDLRGCWLLTEDAILSFHKNDPQIEVRHELVHITPSDQNASNRSSPSQKGKKQQKLPKSQSRSKEETVIGMEFPFLESSCRSCCFSYSQPFRFFIILKQIKDGSIAERNCLQWSIRPWPSIFLIRCIWVNSRKLSAAVEVQVSSCVRI